MAQKFKSSGASTVLKALSDPTRLSVLEMLLEKDSYVSEFINVLKIEPTLLSHHLSILRGQGLIEPTRQGKTVLYKITKGTKISGKNVGLNLGPCKLVFTGEIVKPVAKKTAKKVAKKAAKRKSSK